MRRDRRRLLAAGGGMAAALILPPRAGHAAGAVEIAMAGGRDGSHVWFDPAGIHIRPGQRLRWVNRDPGNSHTTTAFHPENAGHRLRIPAAAAPWDSGYLLPGESFDLTLTVPGVYDYFCIPHEMAGMAGRIVVGGPGDPGWSDATAGEGLPSVERILREGVVRRG